MIDAAAGGSLNNKTPEAAHELIEEMAMNNYQWQSTRSRPVKPVGIHSVDPMTVLAAQLEVLSKKIDGFSITNQQSSVLHCDICGGPHMSQVCQVLATEEDQKELVDYLVNAPRQQGNPYSNTYNLGWRNHPNFS